MDIKADGLYTRGHSYRVESMPSSRHGRRVQPLQGLLKAMQTCYLMMTVVHSTAALPWNFSDKTKGSCRQLRAEQTQVESSTGHEVNQLINIDHDGNTRHSLTDGWVSRI
ncbi:hypothetical protein An07g00340 [Aspergillus niger]|uniref:Uncharacterized protein n=2 Tax=Aspergillus niger TaxID=5061 RepID=A2QM04_ASPNC|nr:hypothetical protein An07g00340 [Aspergillus niger]CAK39258.1 hypothetical protein An07g00340 [Aspergillus niger]